MHNPLDRHEVLDGTLPRDEVWCADLESEPLLFGSRVDPELDRRLRKAVAARRRYRFETERLLWQAQAEDPSCLPVYFALYKFYSHGKRLNDAARALRLALTEAARQGGFHCDWEKLNRLPEHKVVDLGGCEAGLFYLISLKALAFIRLRQNRQEEARALLRHLTRLDPNDRCGSATLHALADSLDNKGDYEHSH